MNITYNEGYANLSDGYVFLAPFNRLNDPGEPSSYGPQIYDNNGVRLPYRRDLDNLRSC